MIYLRTRSSALLVANINIEMYNITDGTTSTKGNELGIFESIGDIYSQADLNLFFTTLARYLSLYISIVLVL